jgi:hypothetical protein
MEWSVIVRPPPPSLEAARVQPEAWTTIPLSMLKHFVTVHFRDLSFSPILPSCASLSPSIAMLDIQDFIAERGGDTKKIIESQQRRHDSVELVQQIADKWEDHRKTQYEATQIGSQINGVQKEIGQIKKAKGDATELLQKKDELTKKKAAQEELAKSKLAELNALAKTVGNYVHESVPVSNNEDDNAEVKKWSPHGVDVTTLKGKLSHHEVLWRLGGYDPERGTKLVGHRGYCCTSAPGARLVAAMRYGASFVGHSTLLRLFNLRNWFCILLRDLS